MAKKLVVFADGTGNAFTTQESNVWRLYQALDQSKPDQLARYIPGVGTSGFAPWAKLDGATGIGVPSNARELYRFLCWNWEPNDEIYMFGFSRGAFTIRALVGLIASEGLIPEQINGQQVSHAEMHRNSAAAWRSYRSNSVGRWRPTILLTRFVRDLVLTIYHLVLRHRSYRTVREETVAQERRVVPIKFLGLFDTVEAYGVPIEELRRAIDWTIWPISFDNRKLWKHVSIARHALALDDERTSFHPLRFDMSDEKTDRIKEVWFAGVHSDIGGGYPDSALAHVPLVWMAAEAELATGTGPQRQVSGLRFSQREVDAFSADASAFGPTHDSRSGLHVIYRYHPRPIAPVDERCSPPVIHHSVVEKMVYGGENYAPITLPKNVKVLMPDGTLEGIAGFGAPEAAAAKQRLRQQGLNPQEQAHDAVAELQPPNSGFVELARDTVWWRRVSYFALLAAILVLVFLPCTASAIVAVLKPCVNTVAMELFGVDDLWGNLVGIDQGFASNLDSISRTLGGLLPSYLGRWIDVFVSYPLVCFTVLVLTIMLYHGNGVLRDLTADRARSAWFSPTGTNAPEPSWLMRFARCMRLSEVSGGMNRFFSQLAWPVLAGAAILLAIAVAVPVTISRTTVSFRSGNGDFCAERKTAEEKKQLVQLQPGMVHPARDFNIDKLCWPTGAELVEGHTYRVWVEMATPFFDQSIMTDIAGFSEGLPRHVPAKLIRRWWNADWFQPIARVGHKGIAEWPLQALDGAVAVKLGENKVPRAAADGTKATESTEQNVPIEFWEADRYKSRLDELRKEQEILDKQKKKETVDPSRIDTCEKIPETELTAAQQIHRDQRGLRRTLVSQFTAPASGELFLYLNDAIAAVPFGPTFKCFYNNNSGRARVTVEAVPMPPLPRG